MEEWMVEAAAGTSEHAAWKALRGGLCAYAPLVCLVLCSGIVSTRTVRRRWLWDSLEFSLKLLTADIKDLEGKQLWIRKYITRQKKLHRIFHNLVEPFLCETAERK